MEGGLGEPATDGELVIRCLLEGSSAGWAGDVCRDIEVPHKTTIKKPAVGQGSHHKPGRSPPDRHQKPN